MREIVVELLFLAIGLYVGRLAVLGRVSIPLTATVLASCIVSAFIFSRPETITKFKHGDFEVELQREADVIKAKTLADIDVEVKKHKELLRSLTVGAEKTRNDLETQKRSVQNMFQDIRNEQAAVEKQKRDLVALSKKANLIKKYIQVLIDNQGVIFSSEEDRNKWFQDRVNAIPDD